ncbi:MAG: Gfo/Idh/MocA family oxidoreductase [Rhizobiaceae bacterium]
MYVVLIGLGMVSDTYINAIASSNGKLSLWGIYSRNANARASFATKLKSKTGATVRCYSSIEEIANDADVDMVVLATPPNARLEIIEILSAAGKPILTEKPLERNSVEARKIVELCEARDVPLGVMLQQRTHPIVRSVHSRLRSREFGAVSFVRIEVPWWRPQSYYDVQGRGSYARDGGGVMISQAIHTFDLALWLVGDVHSVHGFARTSLFHKMESEDLVTAGLEFKNSAIGSFTATTAAYPGAAESIEIHCERASLRIVSGTLQVNWQNGERETTGEELTTGSGADPMAFSCDLHRTVMLNFADAISRGKNPEITGREAMAVHNLIDAIALSSREGRGVLIEEIAA